MTAPGRRVLLAGASGLVGGELLRRLLADPAVAELHTVGRRPLALADAKLTQHTVADLTALPAGLALPPLDEAYIALGTTIAQAGSEAAFRAVDVDAVLAVARTAQAAGARALAVVSALGADSRSRVFYNRSKGEAEAALQQLGLPTLVLARPSLLLGNRAALGQPERPGEAMGAAVNRWLGGLIPARWRPIDAAAVAAAMVRAVRSAQPGVQVLASQDMRGG